jgi:DNA-binding response OmpR family regulator
MRCMMAPPLAATGAPARILVADDDPIILRLLQVNLDLEGFAVDTAARGEDALARAKESPPDVILLDVMMPGLTGWDVARQLKEDARTAGIPIVFLSARTQEEDLRRGEELGVAAYVTKPFDPGELVALIHQLSNTTR